MFSLSKPDREAILAFIASQKTQPFSYPEVGCTRQEAPPKGHIVDRNRVRLGQGTNAFERGKHAVKQWKMFDMPWLALCSPDTPIETGATVAVVVSHIGFWSMNACRIVYVLEEHGAIEKYGFAYGTLPQHGEIGEERFTVELNLADGSVWYDLYAFSRPGPAARLFYPFSRSLQKRFVQDSKAAMLRAVQA